MDKLPDFFVIGASKAGTTAICDVLAAHPDICFSEKKEPNFFSEFDLNSKEIPSERFLEYKELFHVHSSKQLLGEGSVQYLQQSRKAAYWINNYIPSAKIVIILRNPIQRVVSLYEMYTRIGILKISFEEAFTEGSDIVKQCLIYENIMHYFDTFSRDQVLIVIFDDLLNNQDQVFSRIFQFIGVREAMSVPLQQRNQGKFPKLRFLRLLFSRTLVELGKKILPESKHSQVDNFIKNTFFKKIQLTSNQKEELKRVFYSDVSKIGHLIGRDICQEWQIGGVWNSDTN